MSDAAISATYRRAFARVAKALVTFQRVTGFPPNAVTTSFGPINAVVRDYVPDITAVNETGFAASRLGSITQGDHQVIVLASDLRKIGFPLPVKKNDKILLALTGELINVTSADPFKRELGDAIDIVATGVK
jgi:hypothetical protein